MRMRVPLALEWYEIGSDGADCTGGASSRGVVLDNNKIVVSGTYVYFLSLECPGFKFVVVIV